MRRKWRKKTLYIASFLEDCMDDYGNTVATYKKPIFIGEENIQPLSGSVDVSEYGNKVNKMQKVLLDYNKYLGKIKENDLAYIEEATPKDEKVFGNNANYRVDSVRNQNRKIAIYFEKLPNK